MMITKAINNMAMILKFSVYIAASLDGFIARRNGDISWLEDPEFSIPEEDFGFKDFFASIDTFVIGRKTYESALSFTEWPYFGKKVIVLSHTSQKLPSRLTGQVEFMAGSPNELVSQFENSRAKHVYIDGGKTIQSFLEANLIDEMTITTIPLLLGEGIPLFGNLSHDIRLKLLESRSYLNGFVQNRYQILGVD
jgi:dihydrofolate reductase